jgi:hypothetical protein
MYLWYFISVLGEILVLPLYFLSLEHTKLQGKYGKEKGTKIGEIFGLISGWVFFLFWIGIWISPQPRFAARAQRSLYKKSGKEPSWSQNWTQKFWSNSQS